MRVSRRVSVLRRLHPGGFAPRRAVCLILACAITAMPTFADVISYLRFEDGTGLATDQTGLMDGELLNFNNPDVDGWSSDAFGATIPLTGQPNTGSIRFAGGSEFIDLSNYNDLSLGSSFTIEFYMKPTGDSTSVFGFAPLSMTCPPYLGHGV